MERGASGVEGEKKTHTHTNKTTKGDGCQNWEHVQKEWKRGGTSSNTIRSSREDGERYRKRN